MKIRGWASALLLALVSACGGGVPAVTSVSLVSHGTITMSALERHSTTADVAVHVVHQTPAGFYIQLEGGTALVSGLDGGSNDGSTLHLGLTLRDDLPAGTRDASARLHVCQDEDCKQEIAGSPMTLNLRAVVAPNIEVSPLVELSRTGREAAPTTLIPVSVPPEAGTLSLSSSSHAGDGPELTLVDGAIHVTTVQSRAGTYEAYGHLSGSNPLYDAVVEVRYTVNPPPGGEQPLSVSENNVSFALHEGEVQTHRLVVTRPTWTTDFTPLAMEPACDPMYSLRDLGDDVYELQASAVGRPDGPQPSCTVVTRSQGFVAWTTSSAYVNQAFTMAAPQFFQFPPDASAAAFTQTLPIAMADGSAVTWTATSNLPWLKVAQAHGTTGVDPVVISVDRSQMAHYNLDPAHLVVSVARADVPAQDYSVASSLQSNYVRDAWPGVITGSSGRIYLSGWFDQFSWQTDGAVQASGARITGRRLVTDGFFLGNVSTMQLDVDQIVPGQPITVTVTSPIVTTQATVATAAAPTYAAGFAALPYGLRKPPSFSARNASLYFAGGDTIWRYAASPGQWTLSSVSAPGVIDVDPRPDEAHVLSVSASELVQRDPFTLAPVWRVPLGSFSPYATNTIGGAQQPDSKSLVHTSDGDAWVVYDLAPIDPFYASGVGLLQLGLAEDLVPYLPFVNTSRGVHTTVDAQGNAMTPWLAGSAGHRSAFGTSANAPGGTALKGDSADRFDIPDFPSTVPPAAIDDGGDVVLRSDGRLRAYAFQQDLSVNVPAGQLAGGWGLTGDGRFALLYTYAMSGSGDTAVASQPMLHVLDLGTSVGRGPVVEIAALPLSAVPGCGSPRASGERCEHTAHVLADAAGTVAFVVGPRGVAAVPLPAPAMAARVRAHVAAQARHAGGQPLRAAVGVK